MVLLQDFARERFFRLEQAINFFFYRASANKFVYQDIFLLSNTVGSIRCLILDSRIPPTVKMNHVGGSGQVKPCTACFKRQHKKGRALILLKLLYAICTLLNGSLTLERQSFLLKNLAKKFA